MIIIVKIMEVEVTVHYATNDTNTALKLLVNNANEYTLNCQLQMDGKIIQEQQVLKEILMQEVVIFLHFAILHQVLMLIMLMLHC